MSTEDIMNLLAGGATVIEFDLSDEETSPVRISRTATAKLPVVPQHAITHLVDKDCPICMEKLKKNVSHPPCYHMAHKKCLEKCVKHECPVCRTPW